MAQQIVKNTNQKINSRSFNENDETDINSKNAKQLKENSLVGEDR